jgi:ribosomal protein S18 acetylase RimI-like enzyme
MEYKMKIRKATLKDVEQIWKIEVEDRVYHTKITKKKYSLLNKGSIDQTAKKEFLKWRTKTLKDKNRIFLVAEEKNEIIGHVVGTFSTWEWSENPPRFLNLDSIGVFSKQRKKGIATKLIQELEKYVKKRNVEFIYLGHWIKNDIAHELYKKNKFEDFRMEMVKRLK